MTALYTKVSQRCTDQKVTPPLLLGVVKEDIGTELKDFEPFCPNALMLLDDKLEVFKVFDATGKHGITFGALLSLMWKGNARKTVSDVPGNLKGEGFKVGGVAVVGPGQQGVLYSCIETFPEAWVDESAILAACAAMKPSDN